MNTAVAGSLMLCRSNQIVPYQTVASPLLLTQMRSRSVEGGAPISTSRNAHTMNNRALTIVASENGASGLTAAGSGETDCSDGFADG